MKICPAGKFVDGISLLGFPVSKFVDGRRRLNSLWVRLLMTSRLNALLAKPAQCSVSCEQSWLCNLWARLLVASWL